MIMLSGSAAPPARARQRRRFASEGGSVAEVKARGSSGAGTNRSATASPPTLRAELGVQPLGGAERRDREVRGDERIAAIVERVVCGKPAILQRLRVFLQPRRAGSRAQEVLAVVGQLVDRLVDVGQRRVRLRLLEAGQDARASSAAPAPSAC